MPQEMAVACRQPQAEVGLHSIAQLAITTGEFHVNVLPLAEGRAGGPDALCSRPVGQTGLFDYIGVYSHRRCHSTLGFLSPTEFARSYASK